MITVHDRFAKEFFSQDPTAAFSQRLMTADSWIRGKNGPGNDFVGWIDLPENYDREEFSRICAAGKKIASNSDVFLVIGIGGSYLGAKAALDFLKGPYYNQKKKNTPEIYFLGNSFSGDEMNDVLSLCENKRVAVNVISKSGTTTESAIAFRIVRAWMEQRYSKEELKDRIFITTDKQRGALLNFAKTEGYERFVVPDDIGGRFSVLTAVGLLPLAVGGCDVTALMAGAAAMRKKLFADGLDNAAYRYAVLRSALLAQGKSVEMLISYDPYLRSFAEWWKQLFGESEGKQHKGIFPASAVFSTDLHSMGQYVQDGQRILFETVLSQKEGSGDVVIENDPANLDGLNFLSGKTMREVNGKAFLGTALAHGDGGVPTLTLEFDRKDETSLGELCYFFFVACAASAYMLGVNPFDQPGVEAYKKNMFALLGKPGYEELGKTLAKKIETI